GDVLRIERLAEPGTVPIAHGVVDPIEPMRGLRAQQRAQRQHRLLHRDASSSRRRSTLAPTPFVRLVSIGMPSARPFSSVRPARSSSRGEYPVARAGWARRPTRSIGPTVNSDTAAAFRVFMI